MTKEESEMFDRLARINRAKRADDAAAGEGRSFHAQGGVYFVRTLGGWVSVRQNNTDLFSFDPATWASIVAFVSALNGGERYQAALRFHQGQEFGHSEGSPHPYEVDLAAALERIAALGGEASKIALEALTAA